MNAFLFIILLHFNRLKNSSVWENEYAHLEHVYIQVTLALNIPTRAHYICVDHWWQQEQKVISRDL